MKILNYRFNLSVLFLVFLLLSYMQICAVQLPPEVLADQYLLTAQKEMKAQNFLRAKEKYQAIIELKVKIKPEVYYFFAQAIFKSNGDLKQVKDNLTNYIVKAGRSGKYYTESLELLEECDMPRDQFNACGKTWKVGPIDCTWYKAQEWIKSLGNQWRTPTLDELDELHSVVGIKSKVGRRLVWAEAHYMYGKDTEYAWRYHFFQQERGSTKKTWDCYSLAVAVKAH